MLTIHLKPHEVWGFFNSHRLELAQYIVPIAECDGGNTISLTNEGGHPTFEARKPDGGIIARSYALGPKDCEDTVKLFYKMHLIPAPKKAEATPEKPAKEEKSCDVEDEIQEAKDTAYVRQDSVRLALLDFLEVLLGSEEDPDFIDALPETEIDSMLEDIGRLLTGTYGLRIYYPQVIEMEGGEVLIVDYPFEDPEEPEEVQHNTKM